MENNTLLHSTPLRDLIPLLSQALRDDLRDELKQFQPSTPPPVNNDYMTRRDVCKRLRIGLSTLHGYTKDGTLKGYKIGGRVLYRTAEIDQAVHQIQSVKYRRA